MGKFSFRSLVFLDLDSALEQYPQHESDDDQRDVQYGRGEAARDPHGASSLADGPTDEEDDARLTSCLSSIQFLKEELTEKQISLEETNESITHLHLQIHSLQKSIVDLTRSMEEQRSRVLTSGNNGDDGDDGGVSAQDMLAQLQNESNMVQFTARKRLVQLEARLDAATTNKVLLEEDVEHLTRELQRYGGKEGRISENGDTIVDDDDEVSDVSDSCCDQHDNTTTASPLPPPPRRDVENMPPASSRPIHKYSFRLALLLVGIFVVLMMGLAGRNGKALIRSSSSKSQQAQSQKLRDGYGGGGGGESSGVEQSIVAEKRVDEPSQTQTAAQTAAAAALEDNATGDEVAENVLLEPPSDVQEQEYAGGGGGGGTSVATTPAVTTKVEAIDILEGDGLITESPTMVPTTLRPTFAPTNSPTTLAPTTEEPSNIPTRSPTSASPTAIPTPSPTTLTTPQPTTAAPTISCQDDPTYTSPLGMKCHQHATLDCTIFDDVGVLSTAQAQELIERCPVSCRRAECLEEVATGAIVDAIENTSCHSDWSPTCQDSKAFRSKAYRQPCEYFREISCHSLQVIGYNVEAVVDIMNACPCACEVECGTVKVGGGGASIVYTPTSRPTMKPSTSSPTSIPTDMPTTKAPSFAPTGSPTTNQPTTRPSTSAPTAKPSSAPITSSPTTLSPTSSPTLQPSTSSPTLQPTEQVIVSVLESDNVVVPRAEAPPQGTEEAGKGQRYGMTSVQAGAAAGIMALLTLIAVSILYVAQRKRDRRESSIYGSYEDDSSEYHEEEEDDDSKYEEENSYEDEEEEEKTSTADLKHHMFKIDDIMMEPTDSILCAETEDEYEVVVMCEESETVVDVERGNASTVLPEGVKEKEEPKDEPFAGTLSAENDSDEYNTEAQLKSCLRDSAAQQQQDELSPRNVSWGKARVRCVAPTSPTHSADSFRDNPQQSPIEEEWPSKRDIRWYNLGYLKALGKEAMREQMDNLKSSFSSSFG